MPAIELLEIIIELAKYIFHQKIIQRGMTAFCPIYFADYYKAKALRHREKFQQQIEKALNPILSSHDVSEYRRYIHILFSDKGLNWDKLSTVHKYHVSTMLHFQP